MGFVISTTILLWGFVSGFRKWLLQKRKDRIDIYYQAIDSIMGRLREGEEPPEFAGARSSDSSFEER